MTTFGQMLVTITVIVAIIFFNQVQPSSGQFSEEASSACRAKYVKFNGNHTACLRPNGCKITHWGVSKAEQRKIVEVHNHYRNLIASGNETQLGFPSASNMLKMEWDPELAYVAQMHANQCKFEHDCYDCRRTDRYEFVGQNLYIYQTTRSSAEVQWPYVVKEWYDEIQIAPPAVAQSFDLFDLNIGHFTQIAWATTNRVGCGYVTYDTSGSEETSSSSSSNSIFKTAQLYTCNYAPGGNFLGEKMYEDGNAASRCPAKYRRSKRFTSLCEIARATAGSKPSKKKNKNKNKKNPSGSSSTSSSRTTGSTSTRRVTTTVQRISPVRTTTTTFNGENEITGTREQIHSTPIITRFTSTTNSGGGAGQTENLNFFSPSSALLNDNFQPDGNIITTVNLQQPSTAITTTSNNDNSLLVNTIPDERPPPPSSSSFSTTRRIENSDQTWRPSTPLITTSINRFLPSTIATSTSTALQTRPISTLITSTTRRNVAKPTVRPSTTSGSTSTFSLRPFSSRPSSSSSTVEVTATSKRIIPWWDKWSNNFAASTPFNNVNSISRPRSFSRPPTTRSPWRRWTSGWTTSSANNFRRVTQPVIMRFEMSHNGTTTHSINQIF